jgi:hypothetical protein
VLVCCGGMSGGYTLFVQDDKLVWEHNWFNEHRYRVISDAPVPTGHSVLSAEIRVDDPGQPGTGGAVTLRAGEEVIGEGRFDQQVPFRFTVNETFDIGLNTVTPVSDQYVAPFRFTGEIRRVMVEIAGTPFEDLAARARIAMALQ